MTVLYRLFELSHWKQSVQWDYNSYSLSELNLKVYYNNNLYKFREILNFSIGFLICENRNSWKGFYRVCKRTSMRVNFLGPDIASRATMLFVA